MEKLVKATGICCLLVCGFCILAILFIRVFSPEAKNANYFHFNGITVQEGTTLTVADGKLIQTGGKTGFLSIEEPFKRKMKNSLWGLCFLTSLIGGMVLIQASKELKPQSNEQEKVEISSEEGSE